MITDPRGRMVVGQFGAYINEMMAEWDTGIYPGDVILTSDPFKCSASISHTNDWLVLVPIFHEDELVGWSSQFEIGRAHVLNSSHSQISYAVFCLKKKNHRSRHFALRDKTQADAAAGYLHGAG